MKKKVVALMMSAVMAFSLAACGDNAATNGSGSADPNGGGSSEQPSESTPESSPESTPESESVVVKLFCNTCG